MRQNPSSGISYAIVRDSFEKSKPSRTSFPAPCISERYIFIKINLNVYFHTSFWCLKRLYEGLAFIKPLEASQRSVKIKIWVNFLSTFGIGTASIKRLLQWKKWLNIQMHLKVHTLMPQNIYTHIYTNACTNKNTLTRALTPSHTQKSKIWTFEDSKPLIYPIHSKLVACII